MPSRPGFKRSCSDCGEMFQIRANAKDPLPNLCFACSNLPLTDEHVAYLRGTARALFEMLSPIGWNANA